jgi:F-type H+-transporting ATPase subunit alpha
VRPAIDVGISVSRVGGSAQVKSMKKLSGTLKLDLAQYRELEAFAKFGSDLDPTTQRQLKRGQRTVELMKQGEFQPLPVEHQIALLKINNEGLLDELAVDQIREFEAEFLQTISSKFDDELSGLATSGVLDDSLGDKLIETAKTLIHQMTLDA